jgi:hypothetical protein
VNAYACFPDRESAVQFAKKYGVCFGRKKMENKYHVGPAPMLLRIGVTVPLRPM